MAKSPKQVEQEVLALIDSIGNTIPNYELASLQGVNKFILESAKSFLDRAKDNLRKANAIDSGNLESELTFEQEFNGTSFSISIGYPSTSKSAKYYDFVNKGVSGAKTKQPNSKYRFKNSYPNRKMASALMGWINRHTIRDKYDANANKSKFGRKRAGITKMVSEAKKKKSLAYAIASKIKRDGLRKTGYFDDAVRFAFGQDFTNSLSKIMGAEVRLSIKSLYGNNNT